MTLYDVIRLIRRLENLFNSMKIDVSDLKEYKSKNKPNNTVKF